MLNFKSSFITTTALLIVGITMGQAIIAPRQSHAVVAIFSAGALVPAEVCLAAGFGSLPIAMVLAIMGKESSKGYVYAAEGLAVTGLAAILAGVVLLDESGALTPNFQPLTVAHAQEAGISPREMRAFNRQLDRTNSLSESIVRGMAQKQISNAEIAIQYSRSEWAEAHNRGLISTDSYQALTKLSDQAFMARQSRVAH